MALWGLLSKMSEWMDGWIPLRLLVLEHLLQYSYSVFVALKFCIYRKSDDAAN